MNGSEGPDRWAARRRVVLSGILVAGLGVLGLTGAATPGTSLQRTATVVALEASPAVPRTFPPSTSSNAPTPNIPPPAQAIVASAASASPSAPSTILPSAPVSTATPPSTAPAAGASRSAAAASAPAGGSVEDAIATYFGDVYDQAVGVARCESGLDPNAVSRGGSNWGLFQINTVHEQRVVAMGYSWDQILDPYVNAAVARAIYDDASGWGPWGCRRAAR